MLLMAVSSLSFWSWISFCESSTCCLASESSLMIPSYLLVLVASRRSASTPTKLIPSTDRATPAIATARKLGESDKVPPFNVGSGTICTAPIAVK